MTTLKKHPASFRDPSGFIYEYEGNYYRFVSDFYEKEFKHFNSSGLYNALLKNELFLPFEVKEENHWNRNDWHTTLFPKRIPFQNFAWEWSFEQMKDAALTTLHICKTALDHQMILKDATHLNIHFISSKPYWIDSLSFDFYEDGSPWIAYRQFCECFLNPLLIASYKPVEVNKLMLSYPDGIPAAITSSLLPWSTRFNTNILLHVHLQSNLSKQTNQTKEKKAATLSRKGLMHILQSLETVIKNLEPRNKPASTWDDYYQETILSTDYLNEKKQLVSAWINDLNYSSLIDFGTNSGEFALLSKNDALVTAIDMDSSCIEALYKKAKGDQKNILPLVVDLTHPSPGTGWQNNEHLSFFNRFKFDAGLALALIHHLAIAKNISFEQIAALFANQCNQLIIEFVPKDDPKVVEMLGFRKDIFTNYNHEAFEECFSNYFNILKKEKIGQTSRILYQMKRK